MTLAQILESSARRAESTIIPCKEHPPGHHRSLKAAVRGTYGKTAVIAEIKPASPSRGAIRSIPNPAAIARELERGGCCAISVITEPTRFGGSTGTVPLVREAVSVPVLRKDFIVDRRQLTETKYLGADAVLLIAAVLGDQLGEFVDLAFENGLEPLVEVHTLNEAEQALETPADLIGVNNRDLATLRIDLSTTRRIAPLVREAGRTVISESGIIWPCDIAGLRPYADGFLIGSSIMSSRDPRRRLEGFVCQ
jgi:indole-3-glycerol phosphate synthase